MPAKADIVDDNSYVTRVCKVGAIEQKIHDHLLPISYCQYQHQKNLYVLTEQGPSFVCPQFLHLGTKYAS